jgi:hypothetical protein
MVGNFGDQTRIEIGDLSKIEFYDRIKRYGSFNIIIDENTMHNIICAVKPGNMSKQLMILR